MSVASVYIVLSIDGVSGSQLANNENNLGTLLRAAIAAVSNTAESFVRLVFLNTTWSNSTFTTAFYNVSRNVTDANNTNSTETLTVEVQQVSSSEVSQQTPVDAGSPANANGRRRLAAAAEDASSEPPPHGRRAAATDNQCGGDSVCAVDVPEGTDLAFSCPGISIVDAVVFAQFGDPYGVCNAFQYGACSSTLNATTVVGGLCLGRSSCLIPVNAITFGNATAECVGRGFRSLDLQLHCGSPIDLTTSVGIDVIISEGVDVANVTQSLAALYTQPGLYVTQFGSFSYALGNCTGTPFNLSAAVAGGAAPVVTNFRAPSSTPRPPPPPVLQLGASLLLLLLLLLLIPCCCCGWAALAARSRFLVRVIHDDTRSAEAEAQAIADVLREERRVSMAATSATLWRARAAAKEGVDDSGAVDLADIDVAGSAATGAAAKSTLGDLARVWCLRVRVVSFAHAIPVLRREAERVHQGSKDAVPGGAVPVRFVFACPIAARGEDAASIRTLLDSGAAVEWAALRRPALAASGALAGTPPRSPKELDSAAASRVWPTLRLRGVEGGSCTSSQGIYSPAFASPAFAGGTGGPRVPAEGGARSEASPALPGGVAAGGAGASSPGGAQPLSIYSEGFLDTERALANLKT